MKQNASSRKMAQLAREKLGSILLFEIADPALDLVTLTSCEVSLDKSRLVAYVSCEESRYDEVLEALNRAKGRIRSILGQSLGWRVTPELVFKIDTTTDEAEKIERALQEVPPTIGVAKDEFGYPVAVAEEAAAEAGEPLESPTEGAVEA